MATIMDNITIAEFDLMERALGRPIGEESEESGKADYVAAITIIAAHRLGKELSLEEARGLSMPQAQAIQQAGAKAKAETRTPAAVADLLEAIGYTEEGEAGE
ncbi:MULTISPECIES: hypothetical protein [unclassified Actinotignum]|uniref:hypothetical protein n=1 Tax=unclassified Actinotignum TaxID=2632702 RepID=UPI003F46DA97